MNKFTNSLIPVAVLVFFGAGVTSALAFLVVLVASLGFEDWQFFVYFQKLNLPALSIALPIIGMILFAAILLGISVQRRAAVKTMMVGGSLSKTKIQGARNEGPKLTSA